MFGPIKRLRLCGSICPCFESDEERALRVADLLLKSVPIRWYRKLRVAPYPVGGDTLLGATGDVVGWCGGSSHLPAVVRKPTTQPSMTQYVGIDASLDVIDTRKGPALFVFSNDYAFVDDDDSLAGEASKSQHMSKTILLKDIRMASRGNAPIWKAIMGPGEATDVMNKTGIIVYSKQDKCVDEESGADASSAMKMFLVMQVMQGSKLSLTRDEVMKHLNTLIAWDRVGPIIEMAEKEEQDLVPSSASDYHKMEDSTSTKNICSSEQPPTQQSITVRSIGKLSAHEIAAAPEID